MRSTGQFTLTLSCRCEPSLIPSMLSEDMCAGEHDSESSLRHSQDRQRMFADPLARSSHGSPMVDPLQHTKVLQPRIDATWNFFANFCSKITISKPQVFTHDLRSFMHSAHRKGPPMQRATHNDTFPAATGHSQKIICKPTSPPSTAQCSPANKEPSPHTIAPHAVPSQQPNPR